MRRLLIALILLFCTTSLHAQQYEWKVIATPRPGYQIHAVQFLDSLHGWCNPGDLIYSTTDGGHTWIAGGGQSVGANTLSMSDTSNGWAVGFNGPVGGPFESAIMHTTDGGRQWSDQLHIQNRRYVGLASQSNQRVTVVGYSTSFGWPDTARPVQTTDGGRGAEGGNGGVYILRTRDGASSWGSKFISDISVGADELYIDAISFIDTSNGWLFGDVFYQGDSREMILRTVDGGTTWIQESVGLTRSPLAAIMLDAHHG